MGGLTVPAVAKAVGQMEERLKTDGVVLRSTARVLKVLEIENV